MECIKDFYILDEHGFSYAEILEGTFISVRDRCTLLNAKINHLKQPKVNEYYFEIWGEYLD